jgi:serine/threonine protein kinase
MSTFIILPTSSGNFLGEGANKIVTRSIFYNKGQPEVVARALQTKVKKDEMRMMRTVQGMHGIFNILACTKHQEGRKTYRAIYSKLYCPGSLYDAFTKEYTFSLFEKIKIARGILKGLQELHRKKIAHRDIASKNFLINVPQGSVGRRDIEAVIADLGAARTVGEDATSSLRAQGHIIYTPPEAIINEMMQGEDFFLSDVYATGCIFYRLFHGEFAPWQSTRFVLDSKMTAKKRYQELVRRIKRYTFPKKNYLAHKSEDEELSVSEAFEYLILRMVDPDPKKRGTSESLYQEIKRISRRQ